MKTHVQRVPNCLIAVLVFSFALVGAVKQPTVLAQDKEESSRREAEAIRKIEQAGGSVMQISSADPTREVSFYLAGDKITDADIKNLDALSEVIWLNLANTSVTDDGLKAIAGLKLRKLHLEKTGIGDAGLSHLKDMTDLEYLNLYGTAVTDEGLQHLAKLDKLRRVFVWQSKVTEAGMKKLEKQIPGLKVVGESKLPKFEPPKKEEKKPKAKKDQGKEQQLKKKEQALKEKEKQLQEKEEALKKREEALQKKEQELKDAS